VGSSGSGVRQWLHTGDDRGSDQAKCWRI